MLIKICVTLFCIGVLVSGVYMCWAIAYLKNQNAAVYHSPEKLPDSLYKFGIHDSLPDNPDRSYTYDSDSSLGYWSLKNFIIIADKDGMYHAVPAADQYPILSDSYFKSRKCHYIDSVFLFLNPIYKPILDENYN